MRERRLCAQSRGDQRLTFCEFVLRDPAETVVNKASAYKNRGDFFAEQGQYDRALADYNETIRIAPLPNVYAARGNIHALRNDCQRAAVDFDQALEKDPDSVEALVGRGRCVALAGDADRALDHYRRALVINPTAVTAYQARAETNAARQNYAAAIADYSQALEIDNSSIQALGGRGFAFALTGQRDRAIQDLEAATSVPPRTFAERVAQETARLQLASLTNTQQTGQDDVCKNGRICTLVRVFFGTDRKQEKAADHADFGPGRAHTLALGMAGITVPKERKLGDIPRPGYIDRARGSPATGDPAKHFTILKDGIVIYASQDAFLTAVHDYMKDVRDYPEHAFIFIHGYRMSFEAALYRTAQIAYDLGSEVEPFGTAFLYSWPSGGNLQDYKYDFDSARLSVRHLQQFLELVASRSGAKKLHLIAHSMGNWPLLSALQDLNRIAQPAAEINEIILAAPDIDTDEFLEMSAKILGLAKGVTLYASANDLAMRASREVHRGTARAGDVADTGPIITAGVDTIDVSLLNTDALSAGHADYAERKELINDIALILRKGERPPDARTPILRKVRLNDKTYWKYPY